MNPSGLIRTCGLDEGHKKWIQKKYYTRAMIGSIRSLSPSAAALEPVGETRCPELESLYLY